MSTFQKILEKEFTNLSYDFCEERDYFQLTVNKKTVRFKKIESDFIIKPNHWLRQKHENSNIHEPGLISVLSLLSKYFNEHVVFYDVGALFAYHSLIFDKLFDKNKIITVEGNPLSNQYIEKVSRGNKNIKAVNAVLGLKESTDNYYVAGFHFFEHITIKFRLALIFKNLVKTILNLIGKKYTLIKVYQFTLKTITIKSLFKYNKKSSREIFKFDTEGFQSVFLPPYVSTIAERGAIVLLELDHPKTMKRFGISNNEILQKFLNQGYNAYWLDHRQPSVVDRVTKIDFDRNRNSLLVLLPDDVLNMIENK